ncbi:MAG: PAS domain S-box protein, partial [Anaerolineae bacterium]|nr:PAS domain S-box protein [Anaerolineae bacterium]
MAAQVQIVDSLFQAVPLPTALLDSARFVLRANEVWRNTFGPAGVQLRTLLGGQLHVLDDVLASAPGAPHSGLRLNIQPPGGETHAAAFNVQPLGDGYIVVAQFMPDSLPMQDDSRSLLQAALDSTVDGVIILDNEGAVLAANDRFKRMWRLPDDWSAQNSGAEQIILLGKWVRDKESFVRRAEAVLFHPESEGYDVIETVDDRYFEVFHMPYRIGGQIAGRVWSFHDLSDRVRAEHELRESEWRFRQLAENIQVAFWVFDLRIGQLVYVSPTYEKLMHQSVTALRGDAYLWLQSVHPEDRERVMEVVVRAEAGEYQEGEYRLLTPDGNVRWMRSRSFPVRDEQGHVSLIAGIAEDVTARKEAERQALDLALEREKVHILESFIADVSHDLKTPITVLKSSVYLVERFAEKVLSILKQDAEKRAMDTASLIEVEAASVSIRSHAQTLDANVT